MYFGWYFVDGVIAVVIASYMIVQSVLVFPRVIKVLMNATPDGITIKEVKKTLQAIDGVLDICHIHIWSVNEECISMDCHVIGNDFNLIGKVKEVLRDSFGIKHSTIQLETQCDCGMCEA
jgi:cobalt-zinc-cadmium efflux system protein